MVMINVEGYKAFHGTMKIDYKLHKELIENKDWLYKPDTNCWYGAGRSFPADICAPMEEDRND